MSALEFLQTCPPQRKALLSTLAVADGSSPLVIKFETHGFQPLLPYYVSLLVHVECLKNIMKHMVIDEGVAASVMFLSCCKGLGSPVFSKSRNMLTTFDGILFQPHNILPSLEVQLGGKTILIKVEVVDAPLDQG